MEFTSEQLEQIGISYSQYMELSQSEKDVIAEVLAQMIDGDTSVYEQLYYADYREIPVSFEQFISDDNYLGKATRNGEFIYPFWRKECPKIIASDCVEVALSGCLSGDTLIPLIDGTKIPIKDLAEQRRKNFKVYSYDLDTNKFTVGNAVKAFFTGYKMTYNVTFDNGESIHITGNHKFLTRDKHYKSINDGLTVGDSIMPFNTILDERGYEILKHPQKDGTFIEEPTHRMVMRYKIGSFKGTVHHKNYNKRDNSPENLLKMEWWRHKYFHAVRGGLRWKEFNDKLRNGEVPEEVVQRIREGQLKGIRNRWADPQQHIETSRRLTQRNLTNNPSKEYWNSERSNEQREIKRQFVIDYNKTKHPNVVKLNKISKEEVISSLSKHYTPGQTATALGISRTGLFSLCDKYEISTELYLKKTPFNLPNRYWSRILTTYNNLYIEHGELNDNIVRAYGSQGLPLVSNIILRYFDNNAQEFYEIIENYNHKIISIELNKVEPVYDIEVEKYHNFALDAGIVVHNSIGQGKTTVACLIIAYLFYKIMCLRDPQSFFKLSPGSKITVAFLNNTLGSSYGVGYETFQNFVSKSPWFLKHGRMSGRDDPKYIPEAGFDIIVGSRPQHTLGRHIALCLMDEVSFSTGQSADYTKSKIMELYSNIRIRMNSRFTIDGKNYGKLFLVSSKSTENAFLEAYIADQQKKGYPIYVVDQPIWNVRSFAYGTARFKVAVGNKFLPSKIVRGATQEEIDAACVAYEKQGMKIIEVPVEEMQAFDQDIDRALQDLAGISTSVVTKVFNMKKIQKCVSEKYVNPFNTEVVTLGLDDPYTLQDFFDETKIPDFIKGAPTFIHLDASVSGDRTGLSGVAVVGTRRVVDAFSEDKKETDELVCQQVFTVGIQAPTDSEISFEKTRRFIYYLKEEVGLNIKMVTTDGFQSVDTRQILKTKGYETKYTSLDRTPDGYDSLKSGINDQRIILLQNCDELWDELTDLEKDNNTHKYDHPANGKKDEADSLAGAYMDALQYKDEFIFFHPDEFDYEGLNDNTSAQQEYVNEILRNITRDANKATTTLSGSMSHADKDIMTMENTAPSNNTTNDIVSDLLFDDILFL